MVLLLPNKMLSFTVERLGWLGVTLLDLSITMDVAER
jgi:hypothetical protein